MPDVHIGNVDREKYKEADINLTKLAGEIMFTRARTVVNVSHTDNKLCVQMPSSIERTQTWPGLGECVCAPASTALTELGFPHVPACVQRLFASPSACFVLVYTTDLNVFLMFVPVLRVGCEHIALFPWNGYCDEDGESAMLCKKTFVQAVCSMDESRVRILNSAAAQKLSADSVAALLEVADSYALLVRQFQQTRTRLHDVVDNCIKFFSTQSTHSGFLTYTSVTPGVLLSVGHANYLISHGVASDLLCKFVLDHVLAFTTDHQSQTPRDELWLCFLAMFCLKLAHRAAGVCSYRLEKGEDIRPDFAPYVYGTTGDCEDHMGSFLTIIHTLSARGMLRGTVFKHAQLSPDNQTRAFAGRGLMYHEKDKPPEIHAFTVVAQLEQAGACLHIVENTCCVFVYRSEQQKTAVAQALAAYDNGLVAYQSEAQMRAMYRVQWLDKRLVFVFEAGGDSRGMLSQDAAPYTTYASMGVFDCSLQKLKRYMLNAQESTPRCQHLLLVHPVLFLQAFDFLQQYAIKQHHCAGSSQRLAVAEYLHNTEVLHPWWRTIFAERQESMDDAARDMRAVIEREYSGVPHLVTDLRFLPRPVSNVVHSSFCERPPMLEIVRCTLQRLLVILRQIDYAIRLRFYSNNPRCLCIVQHVRVMFQSIDSISGFYANLIRKHTEPLEHVLLACDKYRQNSNVVLCLDQNMLCQIMQSVLNLINAITHCLHAVP